MFELKSEIKQLEKEIIELHAQFKKAANEAILHYAGGNFGLAQLPDGITDRAAYAKQQHEMVWSLEAEIDKKREELTKLREKSKTPARIFAAQSAIMNASRKLGEKNDIVSRTKRAFFELTK